MEVDISLLISFLALILAGLSLYLQRRDKRPRLRLGIEQRYVPSYKPDEYGGSVLHPVPGFTIRARNLTERKIKVEATLFRDGSKKLLHVPDNWKVIEEIPPQESRTFDVSLTKLHDWLDDLGIQDRGKGRFVLIDGTGKEYKTEKVRRYLNQNPIRETDLP